MSGVLSGFFIIAVIVLVGMALGYTNLLGDQGKYVLNRLTYFVAGPALVFTSLLKSDLTVVLSENFAIAAIAGVVTALIGAAIVRFWRHRDAPLTTVAAVSGAMVNSANMGFPIAAYVLGDVALALPVALWQMAFFTPAFQFVLHSSVSGQRPSVRAFALNLAANPMIVASAAGVGLLALDVHPPAFVVEPIDVIAGISIPGMLLAFGMSLTASRPFSKAAGVRVEIVIATVLKLVAMPVLAWALARYAFGLDGLMLYAAVVMAALPTAQNVYVAAARYEVGEDLSRDTALFTSVGTLVALVIITTILGPGAGY
ncbi:MAG: AEC family transporter [Dermabacter sp.]|nr:AEC family transporter [Dermabacter sp.]